MIEISDKKNYTSKINEISDRIVNILNDNLSTKTRFFLVKELVGPKFPNQKDHLKGYFSISCEDLFKNELRERGVSMTVLGRQLVKELSKDEFFKENGVKVIQDPMRIFFFFDLEGKKLPDREFSLGEWAYLSQIELDQFYHQYNKYHMNVFSKVGQMVQNHVRMSYFEPSGVTPEIDLGSGVIPNLAEVSKNLGSKRYTELEQQKMMSLAPEIDRYLSSRILDYRFPVLSERKGDDKYLFPVVFVGDKLVRLKKNLMIRLDAIRDHYAEAKGVKVGVYETILVLNRTGLFVNVDKASPFKVTGKLLDRFLFRPKGESSRVDMDIRREAVSFMEKKRNRDLMNRTIG